MYRKLWIFSIGVMIIALAALPALSQDTTQHHAKEKMTDQKAEKPNQEACPVMGGPIDKEIYTDYNGKRIYFCCKGCDKTFNEDPEKYMSQLKEQGVILEDTPIEQKLCPVSGEPINREVYTDYNGKRIYFCCEGCITKFLESPDKYLKEKK